MRAHAQLLISNRRIDTAASHRYLMIINEEYPHMMRSFYFAAKMPGRDYEPPRRFRELRDAFI